MALRIVPDGPHSWAAWQLDDAQAAVWRSLVAHPGAFDHLGLCGHLMRPGAPLHGRPIAEVYELVRLLGLKGLTRGELRGGVLMLHPRPGVRVQNL